MVHIKEILNLIFHRLKTLYFSNITSNFSLSLLSSIKDKLIYYITFLKTLSLSVKITIIIVVNLVFSFFLYTIMQQLFWFLVTLDLFFILSLRPIFFFFSSYFLTCFFSFCLDDIINLKITLNTISCLSCVILLFVTFFHKSFLVRVFASLSSIILRFFVMGDLMIAGGGVKISNGDTTSIKNIPAPYSLKYNFFEHNGGRVIKTTNHRIIHEKYDIAEAFPGLAKKLYTSTYLEKEPHTIKKDLFILANLKGNQGAAFTSLFHIHDAILKYLTLNTTFSDFRKDAFFNVLKSHSSLLYQDVGAIANIGSYQFRRENLLIISGLLEHHGMKFPIETLERKFSNHDAIIHQNIQTKIDCYSPRNEPYFLGSKLFENPDHTVLVGNFNNDYTQLTSEKVIGTSSKSLQILANMTKQNIDIESLKDTSKDTFSLEGDTTTFTLHSKFLDKQLKKK